MATEPDRLRVWRRPLPDCVELGVCLWKLNSFRHRRVLDVRLGFWRVCIGWLPPGQEQM